MVVSETNKSWKEPSVLRVGTEAETEVDVGGVPTNRKERSSYRRTDSRGGATFTTWLK